MKKTMKLTEQDLRNIIKEAVNELYEGKVVNHKPYFPKGNGYATSDDYLIMHDKTGKIPKSDFDKHNERYLKSHPREDYINPEYRKRDILADRQSEIENSKTTGKPLHMYRDTVQNKLNQMRMDAYFGNDPIRGEEGNYWNNLYGAWEDRLARGNDLDEAITRAIHKLLR